MNAYVYRLEKKVNGMKREILGLRASIAILGLCFIAFVFLSGAAR